MTTKHLNYISTISFFFSYALSLSSFCATEEELLRSYQNAILDAQTAEPAEIYTQLNPILPTNSRLFWNETPEGPMVLVVTFTNWSGYDSMVGKRIRLHEWMSQNPVRSIGSTPMGLYTAARDLWVTPVPEIRDYFKSTSFRGTNLELRAKQLLGLPPYKTYNRFVQFWVKPEDLFRPSADPEITDQSCQIDFPATVGESHRKWIGELIIVQYDQNTGYPWTRLGYTYDWGNPLSEVGLSEYVIRTGAVVDVESVTFIEDYLLITSSAVHWELYE